MSARVRSSWLAAGHAKSPAVLVQWEHRCLASLTARGGGWGRRSLVCLANVRSRAESSDGSSPAQGLQRAERSHQATAARGLQRA
eukprot:3665090-Prymnesium_polylepis.1